VIDHYRSPHGNVNYQADLSNILITYSNLVQGTTAPVVRAEGVNGLTLSNSVISLASPSVPIFDLRARE
jgi:hypothetical protein